MPFENRKWVIVNVSDITDEMISSAIQTSANTLRYNNDNSKTFVKYEGNQPSFLDGKTEYTHDEILIELAKDSWQ